MATEEGRLANSSRWSGLNREKLGSVLNRENLGNVINREKLGNVNVGKTERWASVLGGAALAALALRSRRRRSGIGAGRSAVGLAALAGLPLLWRGATGHCAVYQKMGIDRVNDQAAGTSLASEHVPDTPSTPETFDENRVTRLDERTEGRPVTTTDRQPIGQTF